MGDFDFNQDTLETFKQFQKLKRKKALNKVRTSLANVAEATASTLGNRAARYHSMPDESDTYKTRDQKIAESAPIIKGMEQREQFYFAEALADAQKRQQLRSVEMRAVLQAATQHETSTRAAATAGAQMATRRTEKKITETHRDLQNVLNPSKDTLASVKLAVDGGGFAARAKELTALEESLTEQKEAGMISPEDAMESYSKVADANEQADKVAFQESASLLMEDMEPAQAAHAMTALMESTGTSVADLPPGLANIYNQASQTAIDQNNQLEDLTDSLEIRYEEERRHTYGDSDPAAQAAAQLAGGATERQAARQGIGGGGGGPQEVAGGTTVSEVQEQQQAADGEAQAPEGPPAGPYGETYLNDPNLPKVSGDANQRMEDILDLIEQYPEHPPLQEARNQLMQSADFKKFQDTRGYVDSDVAFREMRRELRAKKQEQKQTSERRVSENVKSGQAPSPQGVRARIRKLARPPSTPVQGSVSRTPVEVNTDGNTQR